jgi:hypothetical protein
VSVRKASEGKLLISWGSNPPLSAILPFLDSPGSPVETQDLFIAANVISSNADHPQGRQPQRGGVDYCPNRSTVLR